MEVLIISSSNEVLTEAPIEFINSIVEGKGGFIKIEVNCPAPKVLWTLKSLILSMGIGFQWSTIKTLMERGMHGEHAEAHVTGMLNRLIDVEIPAMPNKEDIDHIRAKLGKKPGVDGPETPE